MISVKLAFFLRHFPPQKIGPATQMYQLIKSLKKSRKFEIKVYRILYRDINGEHELVDKVIKKDFRRELEVAKNDFGPDLVFFDSPWPIGKDIVKVFRGSLLVTQVLGRMFDEYKDYYKYSNKNKFIQQLKGIYLKVYSRWVLNKVGLILTNGNDISEHLKDNKVFTKTKLIRNGVDTKVFSKNFRGNGVLSYGRISWELGMDRNLNVMKKLKMSCEIFGPGSLSELKKGAKGHSNIKIGGSIDRKGLVNKLSMVRYVLLLFRRVGGIPYTVIESMASGKVVITVDTGDISKIIKTGKNGYTVNSPDEAVSIINNLEKNPSKRKKIMRAARRTIEDGFSWNSLSKDYVGLLEDLLKSRNL